MVRKWIMSKKLVEAFDVKPKNVTVQNIADYDIFPDKALLDSLRSKIIQDLIDNNIPHDVVLEK